MLKSKIREENKNRDFESIGGISANVKYKTGRKGYNSNSFADPDELNNDIDNYMGRNGRFKNPRTSKK